MVEPGFRDQKKERILIAIPAYGGNINVFCFKSVIQLIQNKEIADKYDLTITSVQNEALISRARQDLAKLAVEQNFDKLFFIDADIGFSSKQFQAIADADRDVVGGTYMMKTMNNPRLNFNLSPEMNKEISSKYDVLPSSIAGLAAVKKEYCLETPLIKVKHVPTGFLCIKTSVLKELGSKVPRYLTHPGTNKTLFTSNELERMKTSELFPVSVQDGVLESEDWGFCRLCNENNIDLYLHTDIVVEHVGSIVFHPRFFQATK